MVRVMVKVRVMVRVKVKVRVKVCFEPEGEWHPFDADEFLWHRPRVTARVTSYIIASSAASCMLEWPCTCCIRTLKLKRAASCVTSALGLSTPP